MKQTGDLERISGIELAFGSYMIRGFRSATVENYHREDLNTGVGGHYEAQNNNKKKKKQEVFQCSGIRFFWTEETKLSWDKNAVKKEAWRRKRTVQDPKNSTSQNGLSGVIEFLTADRRTKMNYEVYRSTLSTYSQPKTTKLNYAKTMQVDNEPTGCVQLWNGHFELSEPLKSMRAGHTRSALQQPRSNPEATVCAAPPDICVKSILSQT